MMLYMLRWEAQLELSDMEIIFRADLYDESRKINLKPTKMEKYPKVIIKHFLKLLLHSLHYDDEGQDST
jgi:hypothetical protein